MWKVDLCQQPVPLEGDGHGTKWYVPGREYSRNGIDYGPMEGWRWDPDERFIDDAVEAYEKYIPI